jgi:hypothetical protein
MLLENITRIADRTGSTRPDDSQVLLRERKPHTRLFKDDGVIPNHPRWPLVIYKSAVRLPGALVLIPEDAAPQFRDDAAPRNGMMPPPDSEMISPPITE